jgi:hypothetical protein
MMKLIRGNGDKGKLMIYWKVDCNYDKNGCREHMGYGIKPEYMVFKGKVELGKVKLEFESLNVSIPSYKPFPIGTWPIRDANELEDTIQKIVNEDEFDIADGGVLHDCSIAIPPFGRSIVKALYDYSQLYNQSKNGISPKVENLMNEISMEDRNYKDMGMPEKLSLVCRLTGKVFDENSTKKEIEFSSGEIERLMGTFDSQYNPHEYTKALSLKGNNGIKMCELLLTKYFCMTNIDEGKNIERLAEVEKQLKEINSEDMRK